MEEDESSISVGSTGTLIALMGKEMQIMQARKSFGTYNEYLHYSYRYYSCSKSPSYSSSVCQLAATRRHSLAGPDHQLTHLRSGRYLSRPGGCTSSHVAQPPARHVRSSTSRADRDESTVARSLSGLHVSTSPPPAPLANRHVTPDRSRASSAAAVGPTLGCHVSTSPPGHVGPDRSRANSAANGHRVGTSPPPTPLANGHVSPERGRANSAAAHGPTIGRHVSIRVHSPNSPNGQSSPSPVSFITPSPRDTSKKKKKKKKKGHITIAHDHDDDDDHSDVFTPMLASKIMEHPDNNNNVGLNVVPRSLFKPLEFKCKSARSLSFVDVVNLKGCCPNRTLMTGVLGCRTKQKRFNRLL